MRALASVCVRHTHTHTEHTATTTTVYSPLVKSIKIKRKRNKSRKKRWQTTIVNEENHCTVGQKGSSTIHTHFPAAGAVQPSANVKDHKGGSNLVILICCTVRHPHTRILINIVTFFTHYLTFSTVVVAVNFHLRTRQHFTVVVVVLIVAVVGCYTHHVSKLLNFLVTTLPRSMPRRSTMRCARSGCEVPENTLMFGILECIRFRQPACFSKLSRIKLLARIGLAERTGITQSTSTSFYYKNFFAKAARQRQRRRRTRERD